MFYGHSTRPYLTLHLLCTMWILADSNRFEAFEFEQRFFVNPGSATGAWSGLWNGYVCLVKSRMWGKLTLCRDATPSFALLDVQGPVIVTYVYQQVDGEVSAFSRIPFAVHVSCPSSPCRLIPSILFVTEPWRQIQMRLPTLPPHPFHSFCHRALEAD
jgi:hypothetical protein